MDRKTAERVFKRAQRHRKNNPMPPNRIFRVPGFPGAWSDGHTWVVDSDGGQDWRIIDGHMRKARWPK
jgi:hypothetical protein